jgi:hypothetical protein
MGGGYSKRNTSYGPKAKSLVSKASLTRSVVGTYSVDAERKIRNTFVKPGNLPTKRVGTAAQNPIVIALDNTGSMGDSVFVVWDKMPLLYGQLMMQGYVKDPDVSIASVGDVRKGDKAPLQVCDFARGDTLDDAIESIWVEHGGGGNQRESYDLAYYFYHTHCDLSQPERAFFFSIGDEAPYPRVESSDILNVMGGKEAEPPTFKCLVGDLLKKWEVFHILIPFGGGKFVGKITESWKSSLPPERVLMLSDPKGVVDLILGAIAITNGTRTLPQYLDDLRGINGIREESQTPERIASIEEALTPLWETIQKGGIKPPADNNPLNKRIAHIKVK